MTDETASHTLEFLRRLDAKIDRVLDELHNVKVRLTSVEENTAAMNRRLDRFDERLGRIERHHDLVATPPAE